MTPQPYHLAPSPPLARLIRYFEHLQPADLDHIAQVYAPQARFKDPFHAVQGPQAIAALYRRMFQRLHQPRFVVLSHLEGSAAASTGCLPVLVFDSPAAHTDTPAPAAQGRAFLTWDMHYALRPGSAPQRIHGATELTWDSQGRILSHRDYWDAAEELYEKLPVLGWLMRWLKHRVGSG